MHDSLFFFENTAVYCVLECICTAVQILLEELPCTQSWNTKDKALFQNTTQFYQNQCRGLHFRILYARQFNFTRQSCPALNLEYYQKILVHQFLFLIGQYSVAEIWYFIKKRNENGKNTNFMRKKNKQMPKKSYKSVKQHSYSVLAPLTRDVTCSKLLRDGEIEIWYHFVR